jgi:hypothetical protein
MFYPNKRTGNDSAVIYYHGGGWMLCSAGRNHVLYYVFMHSPLFPGGVTTNQYVINEHVPEITKTNMNTEY